MLGQPPTMSFVCRARVWTALIVPFFLSTLTACTIGLPRTLGARDLGFGYIAKNEDRRSYRAVTPGAVLRMGDGREGFTLGWSDIAVAYPQPRVASEPVLAESGYLAWPFAWTERDERGTRRWWGLFLVERPSPDDRVAVIRYREIGAALHWSRDQTGVSAGFSAGSYLRVTSTTDGMFVLQCLPGRGLPCQLSEF